MMRGRPSPNGLARWPGTGKCVEAWESMEITVYSELVSQEEDEVALRLARRVADAVAAGDHGEAVRLTRELERRLAETGGGEPAEAGAPAFQAPPAVVP